MPLNKALLGLLENDEQITPLPFVLVIGNHSSGKSSFINHVLGREVQTAGVAPTDDGFTIIAPGSRDDEQNGPTLVSTLELGFEGLRMFGSTLISHVALKVRKELNLKGVMMVDSPGMIDSPASYSLGEMTRGYDFEKVVRWFAERADVILLFFDPDKPGTTGETLECLTTSQRHGA